MTENWILAFAGMTDTDSRTENDKKGKFLHSVEFSFCHPRRGSVPEVQTLLTIPIYY